MVSRTFKWMYAPDADDDEEVFSCAQSETFLVEGDPPSDPFVLSAKTWKKLGEPRRIKVTVEVAED